MLEYCTVLFESMMARILYSTKHWQITAFHQVFFVNFHYFHNIPYANGLQFIKVFSAKLPTVLIHQNFTAKVFYCTVIMPCICIMLKIIPV